MEVLVDGHNTYPEKQHMNGQDFFILRTLTSFCWPFRILGNQRIFSMSWSCQINMKTHA